MIIERSSNKIYIYRQNIDMRKGHNGLSFLVTHSMRLDLLSGAVFLFISKDRKAAKALVWDGTGLVLFHKKLEEGKFMCFDKLDEIQEISGLELALILEGSHITIPFSKKKTSFKLKV